jgi:NAD(P)-dependent dehydrogenase (short-subunit alcohol dehydrogenase family)
MMSQSHDWSSLTSFSDRRVIITGAASGIGAALANTLYNLGGKIALFDRDEQRNKDMADHLGSRAKAFAVDVARQDSVNDAVRGAADWLGGIDAVANVAGLLRTGSLADAPISDLMPVLEVNLLGPFHICRAALPALRQGSSPAIVNVASLAASQAYPGGGLYGASKAGLVQLSKQLAIEWASFGIRVNAVSPGSVITPMSKPNGPEEEAAAKALNARIPLRRSAQPHELGNVIAFLLSPAASYVNAQEIHVDGGIDQTVLSGSMNG